MRTWRVGTISMGVSLLILGVVLLLSQFLEINVLSVMGAWWPIILVVLGIEILVYLFISRKEKPFLKYDLLSILLVGMLGTVGIGFAVLSSTGLVEKAANMLERKEQTFDLPEVSTNLSASVKRVVIETEGSPLTIEGGIGKEVAMFGTYRAAVAGKEPLIKEPTDYLSFYEKGDTLYVNVKRIPTDIGPFYHGGTISATIIVPTTVKLEVLGNGNSITMKPRLLLGDWSVEDVSDVSLYVQDDSDVLVAAIGVEDFQGETDKWKTIRESKQLDKDDALQEEASSPDEQGSHRTYKSGGGTHHVQIMNAYSVSLNTVQ